MRKLLALFGLHFHAWVYEDVPDPVFGVRHLLHRRFCACGRRQEFLVTASPALGIETTWVDLDG